MFKWLTVVWILLIALPSSNRAGAETIIERHAFPLLGGFERARTPGETATVAAPRDHSTRPAKKTWWVPFFEVDRTKIGTSTLWSIRNEGATPIDVLVRYHRPDFTEQIAYSVFIDPHGVFTANMRDAFGLEVDADGFARGFVTLVPSGPISVDYFQIDVHQNFANGNLGLTVDDFCADWMVRFLRFGPDSGSRIQLYLAGALGVGGPPSIAGDLYDEQGNFLSSFTIGTNQNSLEFMIDDVTLFQPAFGSIEIRVLSPGGGAVNVSHSAFGKFSVGLPGVCRDGAL